MLHIKYRTITALIAAAVLGLSFTATTRSFADEPATPEPTSNADNFHPFVTYTEFGTSLISAVIFSVADDGTTRIEQQLAIAERMDTLWTIDGKLEPEQVEAIKAAINDPDFAKLEGSYSATDVKDCKGLRITLPSTGAEKRVSVACWVEEKHTEEPVALKAAIDALNIARSTVQPVVVFDWSGGFIGQASRLEVYSDGKVIYTDLRGNGTQSWKIGKKAFLDIAKLGDSIIGVVVPGQSGCADCYNYTITAFTDKGAYAVRFDDSQLEKLPNKDIQQLLVLLTAMKPTV